MASASPSNLNRDIVHLTPFPSLFDTAASKKEGVTFSLSEGTTRDGIIISWATLLQRYTGQDVVAFVVDDRVLSVDNSGNIVQAAAGAHIIQIETAIYFSEKFQTQPTSVYLHVDLGHRTASLFTGYDVPAAHVKNMANQVAGLLKTLSPNFKKGELETVLPLTMNGQSILNPAPTKLPGPQLLHDFLSIRHGRAEDYRHPPHYALEFRCADGTTENLSYQELDIFSDRLAQRLARFVENTEGLKAIPIVLPQSVSLYVSILGVLKSGAAFVPINVDTPTDRLQFLMKDVNASVAIVDSNTKSMFEWDGSPEIFEFDEEDLCNRSRQFPTIDEILSAPKCTLNICTNDPAYIMYTSGSTGTPKGVIISHQAATQSLLAHDKHIPPFTRMLQFAAPTFDVSVFETFFPWFRGATLIGCHRPFLLENLAEVINDMKIDAAELTPTIAGQILCSRARVPNLKLLLTIGEMLTRSIIDEFGDAILYGMYGPTEAAIHCTAAPMFPKGARTGDIGIPFDTVSAFVIDVDARDDGVNILPIGWIGELAVGGWQLADGYLNRPDMNKKAFVDTKEYGRLYRTGDRARMLPSGRIEVFGRVMGGQVKLRGQRIELGEIEEAVSRTPGVRHTIAAVIDQKLVAFVSAPEKDVDVVAVKKSSAKWLPPFMIPSDVVVMREEFPRVPSGKVDRKRLTKEYQERVIEDADDEPDATGIERKISDAIQELLGHRPKLGESLATLGLDSLMAIRLSSNLRNHSIETDVLTIVKADTVSDIAKAIASGTISDWQQLSPESSKKYDIITDAAREAVPTDYHEDILFWIPCTSVQAGMIAETLNDPKAYCNWILLEIPSHLEVESIERAVRRLIEMHEPLCTGFVQTDHGFSQVIWKESREGQFRVTDKVNDEWQIFGIDEFLEPPFRVELVIGEEGKKSLSIHIHHALYDGWSWEILQKDLEHFLSDAAEDHQPISRPSARGLRKSGSVEWELSRSPEALDASRDHWKTILNGSGETLLPNFNPTTNIPRTTETSHLKLSSSRADYEACSRTAKVSPQVLAQTAWAVLLGTCVGKTDVVFGTVVSGRTRPIKDISRVVGPLIQTLPVRVNAAREKTVTDVMTGLQKFNQGLLEHSELGLREIKKIADGEGAFDTLMVWQQTGNEVKSDTVKVVDSRDQLEFALLLEVEPKEDAIFLKATTKADKIPKDQTALLLRQLDGLIKAIIHDAERPIMTLLVELDHSLLAIKNPTPNYEINPSRTLATIFEETVAKYPDIIAVEFMNDITDGNVISESISYAALNSSANRLAKYLIERGVKRDELVAVCMEKSINCYISILGALKAGAGYLPLTLDTPAERIKRILTDANVWFILCTEKLDPTALPEHTVEVWIDGNFLDGTLRLEYTEDNIDGVGGEAGDLAYAVFTSGSTGIPKGVLVENAQIVSNLDVLAEMYPVEQGQRMLQFCSISFDVSVFEIFFAWHRGMTLCSATKDVLLRDLEAAINAMEVSHLSMTPTVAALVHPGNVPSVEFLVTSGEAVTKKVFNNWAGHGLWQGYGPSETTNICTVNPRVQKEHLISNIGPPFRNTSAFVVDPETEDQLVILPAGAIGELCFGGAQVCRGYLNLQQVTEQKFFRHEKYGRIYRSGDIGRIIPTGDVVIEGRKDDQVKIRGNRVELKEITSVLMNSEEVKDAVTVTLKQTEEAQAQLVAFVVMSKGKEVENTIDELFRAAKKFLPSYMVPSDIVPVDTIPMTHQGKTDRRALRKTFLSRFTGAEKTTNNATGEPAAIIADWNPIEKIVANVVSEIANVPVSDIHRTTSLFRLGIDSISTIFLSSRLSKYGFRKLDVSQIMSYPTVPEIAHLLSSTESENMLQERKVKKLDEFSASVKNHVLDQLHDENVHVLKILPCISMQEVILGSGTVDPFQHTIMELKDGGKEGIARLRSAWEKVVEAHEILRTVFVVTQSTDHAYVQVVLKETKLNWKEQEVGTADEMDAAGRGCMDEMKASLSSAQHRPPYAFRILTCRDGASSRMILSFHHALYDGYALSIIFDEVCLAYHGESLPPHPPLDPYLEYIFSLDHTASTSFWSRQLSNFEPSAFPDLTGASAPHRRHLPSNMISLKARCDVPLSQINSAARAQSASVLALGQAAWARILSQYLGEQDICFGNVVSGRTVPVEGIDGIVAPTFNTVPVRINVHPEMRNGNLVSELQKQNVEAIPHQLVPLRRVLRDMKTDGAKLFDTLFIMQSPHEKNSDAKRIWDVLEEWGEMDFVVAVEMIPRVKEDILEIVLHYRRSHVPDEAAEMALKQLGRVVGDVVRQVERKVADFGALEEEEGLVAKSENEVKRIKSQVGEEGMLHKIFERQAATHPDRIALEFLLENGEVRAWTARELNRAANRLARRLIEAGVGIEDAVPIWIEKSPVFYVAVLAVLKVGGVFTPIDPKLPEERRKFMVTELGARCVVTVEGEVEEVGKCAGGGVEVVRVDEFGKGKVGMGGEKEVDREDKEVEDPKVEGLGDKNLAYRIYTSGSTGLPKAVSIEHRQAIQTIRASSLLFQTNAPSEVRILNFAATTFDMCYYDIFLSWTYNLTLCSASKSNLLGSLQSTILILCANLLDLTPTIAATLNPAALPDVWKLYCIGETMSRQVIDSWAGRCVNSYGPTEAAMCCTIQPVDPQKSSNNIGKPFETVGFMALDKTGTHVVPTLAAGELCITGYQLAREYHNNPDLTKERFVEIGGVRGYRTGDVVRRMTNGEWEFVGRADDQVKIRGLRMELEEINTVVGKGLEGKVKEVVTLVLRKEEEEREHLVTFLAVGEGGEGAVEVLEEKNTTELAKKVAVRSLPRYMVPAVILTVSHIPRSAAGKRDRKCLASLYQAYSQTDSLDDDNAEEVKWTQREEIVRQVFSEFSGVEKGRIEKTTTIYEIGLDSISAAQVSAALRKREVEVSVLDLLEYPSIEMLGGMLGQSKEAEDKSSAPEALMKHFDIKPDLILTTTTTTTDKDTAPSESALPAPARGIEIKPDSASRRKTTTDEDGEITSAPSAPALGVEVSLDTAPKMMTTTNDTTQITESADTAEISGMEGERAELAEGEVPKPEEKLAEPTEEAASNSTPLPLAAGNDPPNSTHSSLDAKPTSSLTLATASESVIENTTGTVEKSGEKPIEPELVEPDAEMASATTTEEKEEKPVSPAIEYAKENANVAMAEEEDKPVPHTIQQFRDRFEASVLDRLGEEQVETVEGVYPCTPAQEGMIAQFERSCGKLYYNSVLFKLPEDVEVEKMRKSWEIVVDAMPVLRAGFVEVEDRESGYAMVVYKAGGMKISWEEVGEMSEGVVEETVQNAASAALESLSLPPWNLTLFNNAGERFLLFSGLHTVYDATTLDIVFNALWKHYDHGESPRKLRFDEALNSIILQATSDASKSFWIAHAASTSPTRFPNLTPLRVFSPTSHARQLPSSRSITSLDSSCRSLGVSLPSAVQAAWMRVLAAYIGEPVLTTGIVLSGRTGLEEAEELPFPCLVTIPLVANVNGKNGEFVKEVQRGNVRALKWQHVPVRKIQKWVGVEGEMLDSIFVFQRNAVRKGGVRWETVREEAKVDYTFSMEVLEDEKEGRLVFKATAKDSIVPPEQTEILLKQLNAALNQLLDNPDGEVDDFSNIGPDMLAITSPKIDKIPTGGVELLHQFVEHNARDNPHRLAFEFVTDINKGRVVEKKTWTYEELDREGNRIANYIVSRGVPPGSIIGISFEKCPEATFSILGILKAGCAYVAIDYSAPIQRKVFIGKDSNANMILTMDKYAPEMIAHGVDFPVISAESDTALKLSPTTAVEIDGIDGNSLCYCLYTSGTTGTPKGCELTHENAIQAMLAFQRLFTPHWDQDSKFLQFASFHFDVSVLEQFWSWSVGICATSAPRDLIFSDLAGSISAMKITHLDLTPSLAALLNPDDVPSLHNGVFITGGEALRQDILDKWGAMGCIYNGYGPTEVTIGCTMYPRVPKNGKPSNIGSQFDNVGTFVLAPGTNTLVLRGAVGELCCSGKLVGRGYLNRPDLTAEKFPTLPKPYGERVYRTGDLVRLLCDGTFDFLGRVDDQVKLRGQRLEIGEVNEVVKNASGAGVHSVATLVLKHPKQRKDQLVSFFTTESHKSHITPEVLTTGSGATISILTAACKSKLPAYMVPTHFVPLTTLPLSINNKVDNKALKALYASTALDVLQRIARVEEKEEMWNEVERKVRRVLAEVTGLKETEIQRSSTIFELGLDSVSVLGLARRLRNNGGFEGATPAVVMTHPMVMEMAGVLGEKIMGEDRVKRGVERVREFQAGQKAGVLRTLDIEDEDVEGVYPCTALQEGMIARFVEERSMVYYNCFRMRLEEGVDMERLREAWEEVVKSNAVLRTCFVDTPEGYAQVVRKDWRPKWDEVMCEDVEDVEKVVREARRKAVEENRELMMPPMSLTLIRTPGGKGDVLCCNIFHALYDGSSVPIIFNQVQKAYRSGSAAAASIDVSVPKSQFLEVIPHILYLDETAAKEFWLREIQPAAKGIIEPNIRDPSADSPGSSRFVLDVETYNALELFCRAHQCTMQTIFQTAWAASLADLIREEKITYGIVVSGRTLALDGVEDVIGPTFNTIPCCTNTQGAVSWKNLIAEVQRFSSAVVPYHHTPLRMVHKWVQKARLFDTLFVFQKEEGLGRKRWEELWKVEEGEDDGELDFPIAVEVTQMVKERKVEVTVVRKVGVKKEAAETLVGGVRGRVMALLEDLEAAPGDYQQLLEETGIPEAPKETKEEQVEVNRQGGFEWDEKATTIRSEIARLAEVPEDDVHADASILELGLDSIESIKLSSRLRQKGIQLSLGMIMRNPTIRQMHSQFTDMASTISPSESKDIFREFEALARTQISDLPIESTIYPTTPLQQAMIAETLTTSYTRYFNHDVLLLSPATSLQRLHSAFDIIVKSSEILRTSFFPITLPSHQHTYGQLINPFNPSYWSHRSHVDNSNFLDGAVEETIEAKRKGADLLKEPPFYVTIVTSPEETRIVVSIHHALYDGWSIGMLHQDVKRTYEGVSQPRPSQKGLLRKIVDVDTEEAKRFWSEKLQDAVPTRLPALREPGLQSTTWRCEKRSEVPFDQIQQRCKQLGITVQALGQACWAVMLGRMVGRKDVMFGSVLWGRDEDGADEVMFPAMNTVVVRVVLEGGVKGMLKRVQENAAEVLKWQYTPLREVQKLVEGGERGVFDTLFLYQWGTREKVDGEKLYDSVGGAAEVEYAIAVEMERVSEEGMVWRNACKSEFFDEKGAERVLKELDEVMQRVVELDGEDMDVSDTAFLGCTEHEQETARQGETMFRGAPMGLDEIVNTVEDNIDGIRAIPVIMELEQKSTLVLFISGEKAQDQRSEVAKLCRTRLPYLLVPDYIVLNPGLLQSVDALRHEFEQMPETTKHQYALKGDVHEWSELEERLRAVVSKVSGISEEDIKRTQTIFHLGLDSISAIQLSADFRKAGISLGVAQILEAATIERMALTLGNIEGPIAPLNTQEIIQKTLSGIDYDLKGAAPESIEMVLPATSGQSFMLSAWKNSNYTLFNPTFTFKTNVVDLLSLTAAWEQLIRRTPVLRTTFRQTNNLNLPYVQLILRSPPTQFRSYVVSHTVDSSFISRLYEDERDHKLDMTLPPVRLTVLLAPTETYLFLTIHHALYDGVSLPLLLQKLNSSLSTPTQQRISTPDPEPSKFPDFIALTTTSANVESQKSFWTEYLKDTTSTLLASKLSRSLPRTRSSIFIPAALTSVSTFAAACQRNGISLQSAFLAAFAMKYHYSLNLDVNRDLVIGIYMSNRHHAIQDLATMVSPTLNLVILRVKMVDGGRKLGLVDIAKQVQEDLVGMGKVERGMVGLERVKEWTGVEVDCWFNYLKMPGGDEEGRTGLEEVVMEVGEEERRMEVEGWEEGMKGCCRTNFDVEVRVRGEEVDVGMFSLGVFFDGEELGELVEGLCESVREIA